MDEDRRDLFRKIGMLGAGALAVMGVSRRAKAFEGTAQQNPLLGLWDLSFPGGGPPLYYKYAISEGAYVATGNLDDDPTVFGFKYSPTMGTYARTGPNSYRLRERVWAMNADGAPAGYADFTGTALVAADGKSWSGSGTYIQYDLSGNVVFDDAITYTATKFPPGPATAAPAAAVGAKSRFHSM